MLSNKFYLLINLIFFFVDLNDLHHFHSIPRNNEITNLGTSGFFLHTFYTVLYVIKKIKSKYRNSLLKSFCFYPRHI